MGIRKGDFIPPIFCFLKTVHIAFCKTHLRKEGLDEFDDEFTTTAVVVSKINMLTKLLFGEQKHRIFFIQILVEVNGEFTYLLRD